jgi:hypothetical protein
MGSGTGSPLIPPGRQRTEVEDKRSQSGRAVLGLDPRTSRHKLLVFLSIVTLSIVTHYFECALKMSAIKLTRAISTGKLHALPRFHIRPINVVVYHGS